MFFRNCSGSLRHREAQQGRGDPTSRSLRGAQRRGNLIKEFLYEIASPGARNDRKDLNNYILSINRGDGGVGVRTSPGRHSRVGGNPDKFKNEKTTPFPI